MAGVGSFNDVALLNIPDLKGEKLDRFRKTMHDIDPIHYVNHAAPSSLFYQFGTHDTFIQEKLSLIFIMPEVSPNMFNGMKQTTILTRKPV